MTKKIFLKGRDTISLHPQSCPYPQKKSPSPDGFTEESCQIYREELLLLHKLFLKIEEERTLPKPFSEAFFPLVNKLDKDSTMKRKLQTNVSHELRQKNAQYIRDRIQQCIIRIIHMIKWNLSQVWKCDSAFKNQCNPPDQQAKEKS